MHVVGKQWLNFVNVVGQQCMEINFVNICERSGQQCMEINFVNICECSGQETRGNKLCEHL